MKQFPYFVLLVSLFGLGGCPGGVSTFDSTVTGTVVDANFNPVRDATVTAGGQSTTTTNSGAYVLTNLPDGEVEVRADAIVSGVPYRGRTSILNFIGEQQNSVNVMVGPAATLGQITGTVTDRDGFLLQGASVFAYHGSGSSTRSFTDANGRYTIRDLVPNLSYTVSASGQGYRSDQTAVVLANSETRVRNFVLDNPGLPGLTPPQNIGVTSWVSHPTSRSERSGLEWAKSNYGDKQINRKFRARSRALRPDMVVEVELFWDQQQFPDLFGFGVYRGIGASGAVTGIDFYFDPLAPYYADIGTEPFSTYSYALTTISAQYPNFSSQTESALSSRVVASTLGLLQTNPVGAGTTFSWQGGSGATQYVVYVFDEFPTGSVSAIWDTESSPTSGLSQAYGGPPLVSGNTYHYLVLGIANGAESRTISKVGSFVP